MIKPSSLFPSSHRGLTLRRAIVVADNDGRMTTARHLADAAVMGVDATYGPTGAATIRLL
jgi:hypothetical protein